MLRCLAPFALLLALAGPAQAAASDQPAPSALAQVPQGTRLGLLVVDEGGREVLALNPDQRFIPASNTKIATTAAAYVYLADEARAAEGATTLYLQDQAKGPPSLVISGGGGISLSSAADCVSRCLASLVEQALGGRRKVGDVIGDDRAFTDQRWSLGMSWNNIGTDDGTALSALIVDDNEVPITVSPGAEGGAAQVALSPYFTLDNRTLTVAGGATSIAIERAVNSRTIRVYGTIGTAARSWRDSIGIDDGAHYAAWAVRQVLAARGVAITGRIRVLHREAGGAAPEPAPGARIAALAPPLPLDEVVTTINKDSQNLHAEALLRRIGIARDGQGLPDPLPHQPGSTEGGLAAVKAMLESAGLPRAGYDLSDGSGMSTYNRLSPRATVMLLRWIAAQHWGERWYASLPVGGVDGTLKRRFAGTPLAGKIRAKTGALNATLALSGQLQAASGRKLTFAIFANDVPSGQPVLPVIDTLLVQLAAAN